MQKILLESKKNVPMDTSLVCSSTNSVVNKEETLSQRNRYQNLTSDIRLDNINPEENPVQHRGRSLKAIVYVISKNGLPLTPCSFAKSKRMVKTGKACVIKRFPFVIQLNFICDNHVQKNILGLDIGYKYIGVSVINEKQELLSLEVKLRTDIGDKLKERKSYRRNRRNKLWYRKPRFMNRKRNTGWLAPSVQQKVDTHIQLVDKISKFILISKIVIEVASFDIQKIMNPDISGVVYQQGNLYGYENVKSYILARERGMCQLCGKEFSTGNHFRLHHIQQRSNGGTDKPDNLVLLHEKCHTRVHKHGLEFKKNKQYKEATFMNIVTSRIIQELGTKYIVEKMYGYETKIKRNELRLEKSHTTDAFVISGGNEQLRSMEFKWIQKQKNNRSIQQNRKGQQIAIRRNRYQIQSKDLIWIQGKQFISKGCQNSGTRVAYNDISGKNKTVKIVDIGKFYNYGSFYPISLTTA